MTALYVATFLIGIMFRQIMRFQEALAELAKNMAIAKNAPASAQSYQNAITPPWLANMWMLGFIGISTLVITAWYVRGVSSAVVAGACFLAGMVASGIASNSLQRPTLKAYLQCTLHSLVNRQADYRMKNDHMRANASQELKELLALLAGPDLIR